MKKCSKCYKLLPLKLFCKRTTSSDGLNYCCKICVSDYNHDYALRNPEKILLRNGLRTTKIKTEQSASYYFLHRDRAIAHKRLNMALKKGLICKTACFECGNTLTEAHHADYSKALSVIWLCKVHHMQTHREHNNHALKLIV